MLVNGLLISFLEYKLCTVGSIVCYMYMYVCKLYSERKIHFPIRVRGRKLIFLIREMGEKFLQLEIIEALLL